MTTAARLTQAALDVLMAASAGDAEVRVTQVALEVLYAPVTADVNATQVPVEVLVAGNDADVNLTALHLEVLVELQEQVPGSAFVQLLVSGASAINAIGRTPLQVSFEWVDPGASFAGGTFSWLFSDVGNEAGFASTDTTSAVTQTYSHGGGILEIRGITTTISSPGGESNTVQFVVHPRAQQAPTPFDGNLVIETQPTRRVWPM